MGFAETYVAVNEKFYCFPLVKAVIGVEFANLYDAKYFKRLVDKFAFGGDPKQVLKEEKKKYGLQSYKLSRPNLFVRKQHNGWNPITQTFSIKEFPTEFKIILKKAGFKKKHLKKKETAIVIYEYLLKHTEIEEDMLTKKEPARQQTGGAGSYYPSDSDAGIVRPKFSDPPSGERLTLSYRKALDASLSTDKVESQTDGHGLLKSGSRSELMTAPAGIQSQSTFGDNLRQSLPQPSMPRVPAAPPLRGGAPRAPPMRPRTNRPRAPPVKAPARPRAPQNRPPPKQELSLQEQLQARLGGLKKVDQSAIQKEKQQSRLTGQQEMKLTAQMATLAQQLSAR